jgi:PAS domain S-box-containing protein
LGFQTNDSPKILGNIPFKSLEAILDSIPSAIVITDAKGKFLYVNPRGMELYGIKNVDLETQLSKVEILKSNGSPFPTEEMPITNSIKGGKAVRNIEMTIKRADGNRLHALVSSAPLYDANGKVFAAIVIFEDITERIQTEVALKESEERYKTLVETSTDAIVVHKNGHFLFANSSALALFGAKTFEELKSRTIFDFMSPDEKPSVMKRIAEAGGGQKLLPKEEQVVRLDGTHVPVEAIGAPIWYSGEQAVLVILRDITQRVELSQKLAEYTNSLERLVERRTKEIIDKEKRYHEIYDSFGEALIATDWEFNVIHWNKAAERVTTVKATDALGKKV